MADKRKLSLGVDIGGTGCKCVAFREDGTRLALSYREYPLAAGSAELPPDILTESVFQVISQCVSQLEHRENIAALTVSSFGESFAALDEEGNPLTDILLYYDISRNDSFSRVVEQVGTEKFMEITKIYPDAAYSLSRMLQTLQQAKKPVWKFLFIAGYLCYRLSGRAVTDVSLACRSLLYDVEKGCWSRELLEASGIREDLLPPIVPTGSLVGTILPRIAARLGLPETTAVVIGSHDQIVNALGAGVTQPGDAVDTCGTCECLTPLFPRIPESRTFQKKNFACVPYLNHLGYVTYAYNISAGSVVRWYRDALGFSLREEAARQSRSIYDLFNETCPPEPTDLMVLPFLQGMGGTPDSDPGATGLIAGLTTQTRLPDLYRAILEGITYEIRYNQEQLQSEGIRWNRLFACGGGARSKVWLQIKADILGSPIFPVAEEETGAMGSAILGLAAVTGADIMETAKPFLRHGEAVLPNPSHQELYNQKYQAYKALRALYTRH